MRAKLLRLWAYSTFFWAAFSVFFYLTFPVNRVKGVIVDRMEEALGKGKQGAYGVDPVVTIGKLSMWRLSGLDAKNVSVQLGSRDPDPGPTIDIDRVQVRVGLISLLQDTKSVSFQAELYDGDVDGSVVVDPKGGAVHALDLDVEKIDLAKAPLLVGRLGVPATGRLNLKADLDLGKEPEKSAKGNIKVDVETISLGPGELKIPLPGLTGGLTLPLIDMGNVTGEVVVAQGKGKIEKLKMDGKAITGELDGELALRGKIGTSRLDADGWIKISDQFLDENAKFKTLLEFPGPLQRAKDDEGRYHFTMKGTLAAPTPALARDAGKRAAPKPVKPKPPREKKEAPAVAPIASEPVALEPKEEAKPPEEPKPPEEVKPPEEPKPPEEMKPPEEAKPPEEPAVEPSPQ